MTLDAAGLQGDAAGLQGALLLLSEVLGMKHGAARFCFPITSWRQRLCVYEPYSADGGSTGHPTLVESSGKQGPQSPLHKFLNFRKKSVQGGSSRGPVTAAAD